MPQSNQPELGATSTGSVGFSPVRSTAVADNSVTSMMQGLNGLINTAVKYQAYQKVQQNEEDVQNAKFLAKQDMTEIETALLSGNSSNHELNTIYSKGKEANLTDTEISNSMYEHVIGTRASDIRDSKGQIREAGIGDQRYFEAMVDGQNKNWRVLAVADREKVAKQQVDKAYATSFMDADTQTEFNNAYKVLKGYNVQEGQLEASYISRAYDLAKKGDRSALDKLASIKNSQGVPIIDTTVGSELNSKKQDELLRFRDQESSRIERDQKIKMDDLTSSLFANFLNGSDRSSIQTQIKHEAKMGNLDFSHSHALLSTLKEMTKPESEYPKQSDPVHLQALIDKANAGEFNPATDLKGKTISYNDVEYLVKTQSANGSVFGDSNAEVKAVNDAVNIYSQSMSGVNFENKITMKFGNAGEAMQVGFRAEAGLALKQEVSAFRKLRGRQPNVDELAEIARNTESKLRPQWEKRIEASSKIAVTPKAPQKSSNVKVDPVKIVDTYYEWEQVLANNGKEASDAFFKSQPTAVQEELIKQYEIKRKAKKKE